MRLLRGHIRDEAGNDANRTLPDIATFTGNNAIKIDGIVPADFQTGTVVTVGDSVVTGYLNEDNTAIKVTVPIANDASLENGKVQIQAKIGANNYANIGSAVTITNGDLGVIRSLQFLKAT